MGIVIFGILALSVLAEATVNILAPLFIYFAIEYPLMNIPYLVSLFAGMGYTCAIGFNAFAVLGVKHRLGVVLTGILVTGIAGYINHFTGGSAEVPADDDRD